MVDRPRRTLGTFPPGHRAESGSMEVWNRERKRAARVADDLSCARGSGVSGNASTRSGRPLYARGSRRLPPAVPEETDRPAARTSRITEVMMGKSAERPNSSRIPRPMYPVMIMEPPHVDP